MADPKMRWDKKQNRWRGMYKRKRFSVKAKDLGGTCRDDTVVAANQWFEQQKAKRDAFLRQETLRPYEADYQSELEGIQTTLRELAVMMKNQDMRSMVEPVYHVTKEKEARLKELYRQESLPVLDDSLRNPLHISAKQVEEEVEKDLIEDMYHYLLDDYDSHKPITGWLESNGYHDPKRYSGWFPLPVVCVLTGNFVGDPDKIDGELLADTVEEVVEKANHRIIRERAEAAYHQRKVALDKKKQQIGVIDDYTRGMLNQHMKEQGAVVPETKSLPHHIDLFIKFQESRHKQGKIKAGQLGQLKIYMDYYQAWAKEQHIHNINAIGTLKSVDNYFYHLINKLGTGKGQIDPSYAKKLFNCFKRFVHFLIDQRELDIMPPWNNRRDDKYTIKEIRKNPETITLSVLRQVYEAAPVRLKLFMALVLNCGFGASEIGQLEKVEYDRKNVRIVHKRVKTEDCDNVPTVTFRLWSRTVKLLESQIEIQKQYPIHDGYKDRLLLNNNGKGLWYESYANGSHKKNDNISKEFQRLIQRFKEDDPKFPDFTFYMLRRTAASLIHNQKEFSHLHELWLGHSPKTTATRHYIVPDDNTLDECLTWLEQKLFVKPIVNGEGDKAVPTRVVVA